MCQRRRGRLPQAPALPLWITTTDRSSDADAPAESCAGTPPVHFVSTFLPPTGRICVAAGQRRLSRRPHACPQPVDKPVHSDTPHRPHPVPSRVHRRRGTVVDGLCTSLLACCTRSPRCSGPARKGKANGFGSTGGSVTSRVPRRVPRRVPPPSSPAEAPGVSNVGRDPPRVTAGNRGIPRPSSGMAGERPASTRGRPVFGGKPPGQGRVNSRQSAGTGRAGATGRGRPVFGGKPPGQGRVKRRQSRGRGGGSGGRAAKVG
jgi:hypothetical protein